MMSSEDYKRYKAQVEDLYLDGNTPEDIAQYLRIPYPMVKVIIKKIDLVEGR